MRSVRVLPSRQRGPRWWCKASKTSPASSSRWPTAHGWRGQRGRSSHQRIFGATRVRDRRRGVPRLSVQRKSAAVDAKSRPASAFSGRLFGLLAATLSCAQLRLHILHRPAHSLSDLELYLSAARAAQFAEDLLACMPGACSSLGSPASLARVQLSRPCETDERAPPATMQLTVPSTRRGWCRLHQTPPRMKPIDELVSLAAPCARVQLRVARFAVIRGPLLCQLQGARAAEFWLRLQILRRPLGGGCGHLLRSALTKLNRGLERAASLTQSNGLSAAPPRRPYFPARHGGQSEQQQLRRVSYYIKIGHS